MSRAFRCPLVAVGGSAGGSWLPDSFITGRKRVSTVSNILQARHVFAACWRSAWKHLICADLTGKRPAKLISVCAAVPELISGRQHAYTLRNEPAQRQARLCAAAQTARAQYLPQTIHLQTNTHAGPPRKHGNQREPAQSAGVNRTGPGPALQASAAEYFPSVCVSNDKHFTCNHKSMSFTGERRAFPTAALHRERLCASFRLFMADPNYGIRFPQNPTDCHGRPSLPGRDGEERHPSLNCRPFGKREKNKPRPSEKTFTSQRKSCWQRPSQSPDRNITNLNFWAVCM